MSWSDWLTTEPIERIAKNTYCSFKKARRFAKSLGLQTREEWKAWVNGEFQAFELPKKPKDIPKYPAYVYEESGWRGWGDWLGTGRSWYRGGTNFRSFEEARKFVHQLGLKNHKEWRAWAKTEARPEYIPSTPNQVYKKEGKWKGLGDWLGTGYIASSRQVYHSFEEACTFASSIE